MEKLTIQEEENDICNLPSCPFLVVIRTTPFAALLPYKAAAEGPLRIEILSDRKSTRLNSSHSV